MWLGSSVVRVLARYARVPGFESRSGRVLCPPLCHLVAQCGSVFELRAAKGLSSVPVWFRLDSGSNLIKQGEIVIGRPCRSVAQWSECPHGVLLGSSPGRAACFFLPCDICNHLRNILCRRRETTMSNAPTIKAIKIPLVCRNRGLRHTMRHFLGIFILILVD